ncbi:hypothetical protein [Parashewanella tropica]|uniref:hypothetical protein n=1 Tax=Parashewanella tropica TaxID=2547970 RepID=UPI0010599811|nr:hypothetical protein [Parashewanella tropica]
MLSTVTLHANGSVSFSRSIRKSEEIPEQQETLEQASGSTCEINNTEACCTPSQSELISTLKSLLANQQIDLTNADSILFFLNQIKGVEVRIIKRSKDLRDASIFKIQMNNGFPPLSIKIHPDNSSSAKRNASPSRVQRLNECGATSHVFESFIVTSQKTEYRVYVYQYVHGKTLVKALNEKDIDIKTAKALMAELTTRLHRIGYQTSCLCLSDIILTPEQNLKITDWNKLVDSEHLDLNLQQMKKTTEHLITLYETARCIFS